MTLVEWKEDFKGYINALILPRDDYRGIMNYIDKVPVVEINHGRWIDVGSGQFCSVCGEFQPGYDNYRFYCAKCGARMDGEGRNEE